MNQRLKLISFTLFIFTYTYSLLISHLLSDAQPSPQSRRTQHCTFSRSSEQQLINIVIIKFHACLSFLSTGRMKSSKEDARRTELRIVNIRIPDSWLLIIIDHASWQILCEVGSYFSSHIIQRAFSACSTSFRLSHKQPVTNVKIGKQVEIVTSRS